MKILAIGDIVGQTGVAHLRANLRKIKLRKQVVRCGQNVLIRKAQHVNNGGIVSFHVASLPFYALYAVAAA